MIFATATGGSSQLHLDWAPEHSPRLHTPSRFGIYRTGALFGDMAFILAGRSPLAKLLPSPALTAGRLAGTLKAA